MELFLIQETVLIVSAAIAAYTDWKTGLIYDWVTLPLVGVGAVLMVWTQNWIGLGLGIAVFVFLFLLYWLGKLGGGDVKLFTGIALVLPFYHNQVFLIPVLFFAGLAAISCYSIYYLYRIHQKKIPWDWKKNKASVLKGILFAALFSVYLLVLAQVNGISQLVALGLWIPFLLGSLFVIFENPIKKHFFAKTVAVDALGEDEVIALELTDEKILKKTGLGLKGIIGETEKQKLKEMGITEVTIYANAPKFGPFIFAGILLALWFPEIISLFFLRI